MFTPPVEVEAILAPFASLFTRPSWQRAQALFCGVLLAPANCVITSALRVLGLSSDKHFQNYHLYKPAPPRRPGQKGRRQVKGERLPTPKEYLASHRTKWSRVLVNWYGGARRWVEVADASAVWWRAGKPPVNIRWVLVRDPKKRVRPLALLCTDVHLPVTHVVGHFVRRWAMETTFQETRVYFGIEGQRQWNDLAVARSMPLRLALFSMVTLMVHQQSDWQASVRQAAWY